MLNMVLTTDAAPQKVPGKIARLRAYHILLHKERADDGKQIIRCTKPQSFGGQSLARGSQIFEQPLAGKKIGVSSVGTLKLFST